MKTQWTKVVAVLLMAALLMGGMLAQAEGTDSQRLDVYYSLAVGNIGREDYDKAMTYLDKALELATEENNPEMYADLRLKKGCVYTIRGEYEDAIRELAEATRVQPELAEPYLVRVQVYTELKDMAKAAADLEKYIELTGDTDMQETLAQMYLQLEDRSKAEESYRRVAEQVSEDESLVPYNLAVYEMNAGMYEEALANLLLCEPDTEKMPGFYYNIGVCRMMLNQYPEAVEAFTASMESEDYYTDAMYNRAICGVSTQDFEAAAADFTAYIDRFEGAPETEAADGEATESTKGEAAKPDGEMEMVAYYYRGVSWLSVGKFEEAAADFTVCLEKGINVNESALNRGLSYLQGGKFEEAKADFTACIEAEYAVDDALFYRAYAHRYLDDNQAALEDLTQCVEHGYQLGQTYQQRAQVYQALGDEEHYLEDLESALEYLED